MRTQEALNPFELVLKTPYFKCNPRAKTEVHTITGRDYHLFFYILAVKSLLRFYNDIAIVVHDDGSLTNKDTMLLENHIRGIKIIEKRIADKKIAGILKRFPNSSKYRSSYFNSMQLFDYTFFSKTDKILSLDSDTLFLRKPNQLIEWISNDKKEIIWCYEQKALGQEEFLSEIKCDFPPHVNIGLLCFYKQIIDLEKIEDTLGKRKTFDWVTGQNVFPVLIKNKSRKYKISFFDTTKYQCPLIFKNRLIFKNGAIFKHYWTSWGIQKVYTKEFIKVSIEIIKKKNKNDR